MSMYPECFEDTVGSFGCYNVTVDPNIKPVVHTSHHGPPELREKLKGELDKIEKKKTNAHKTDATNWLSELSCN